MKITQISVFLENKAGRLYDVCSLLGQNNINISALSIAENEGFGILRIVVNKPQEAVKLLKQNNFMANLTEIVAVEIPDKPGSLASILKILNDNVINVEYMYGFLEKNSDQALLVFRFDDPDKAIKVLTKEKVRILKEADINKL